MHMTQTLFTNINTTHKRGFSRSVLVFLTIITLSTQTIPDKSFIQDLNLPLPYFSDQASDWTVYTSGFQVNTDNVVTADCNQTPLLGGIDPSQTNAAIYQVGYSNLKAHNSVFITIEISFIDSWASGDGIILTVGDGSGASQQVTITFNGPSSSWTNQVCGNALYSDLISQAVLSAIVDYSTSDLQLIVTASNPSGLGQLAIRDVRVSLSDKTVASVGGTAGTTTATLVSKGPVLPLDTVATCKINQYESAPGICSSCNAGCQTCTGPLDTDCLVCNDGYSYDGSKCIQCHSSCQTCFGTNDNDCYSCNFGEYLGVDHRCTSTCDSQYIRQDGINLYCDAPKCSSGNTFASSSETLYYYPDDGTCKNICPAPYTPSYRDTTAECALTLSSNQVKQMQTLSSDATTTSDTMSGLLITTAALQPSDPNGISAGTLAKLFEYTRYYDVSRSQKLEFYYKQRRSVPGTVVIGPGLTNDTITEFTYRSLPSIFVRNNLYSSFLVNFFDNFQTLLILLAAVLFLFSLELAIKKYLQKFAGHFRKLSVGVFAFFVMQFYNVYMEILFFATLEFKTFEGGNARDWISFLLAIFFYLLACFVLFLHARLLWRYQSCKSQTKDEEEGKKNMEDFQKSHDHVEMLYKDFRDLSFLPQGYLFFSTLRVLLSGVIMSALFAHPIVQTCLNILFNFIMITYLSIKYPFKNIFSVLQQLVYELILLLLNMCFLVAASLDAQGTNSDDSREKIGDLVIIIIFISKFVPVITIIPQVIEALKGVLKTLKDRKKAQETKEEAKEEAKQSGIQTPDTQLANQENKAEAASVEMVKLDIPEEDNQINQITRKRPTETDPILASTRKDQLDNNNTTSSRSNLEANNELADGEAINQIIDVFMRESLWKDGFKSTSTNHAE